MRHQCKAPSRCNPSAIYEIAITFRSYSSKRRRDATQIRPIMITCANSIEAVPSFWWRLNHVRSWVLIVHDAFVSDRVPSASCVNPAESGRLPRSAVGTAVILALGQRLSWSPVSIPFSFVLDSMWYMLVQGLLKMAHANQRLALWRLFVI